MNALAQYKPVMTVNDKLGLQLRKQHARPTEQRSSLVGMTDADRWFKVMGIDLGKVVVNEDTALGLSAFYRCVDLISDTFALPSFKVFKEDAETGDSKKWPNHPVYNLINFRPNRLQSSFDWRKAMRVSAEVWGNGISQIISNPETNRPVEFKFLKPGNYHFLDTEDRLLVQITKTGQILQEEEYIHFKSLNTDGKIGLGKAGLMQRVLKVQMLAENYLSKYYENGTHTNGYLSIPTKPPKDVLTQIGESWDETYSGAYNSFTTPVLPLGTEYKSIAKSNVESQLSEFLNQNPSNIYTAFGVPPHLAGDMTKTTSFGKGIEDLTIQFLQYTMLPKVRQAEQEMEYKCLRSNEYGKYRFKMNLRSLERANFVDQAEGLFKLSQAGVYSPSDIRQKLGENSYPGGDKYMVNGNMIGVDAVPTEPINQNTNSNEEGV